MGCRAYSFSFQSQQLHPTWLDGRGATGSHAIEAAFAYRLVNLDGMAIEGLVRDLHLGQATARWDFAIGRIAVKGPHDAHR